MSSSIPQSDAASPSLSPIVAGVWRMASWEMDVAQRVRWISNCLDAGVTTFDHADIYGDYTVESLFGEALAAAPGLRSRMQLVTKCGIKLVSPRRPTHAVKSYDSSPAHVIASVEQSLRALRTDHIELLLLHRPDALLDPDLTGEALERLRADGKVVHFGVSNHSPAQLALLHQRVPLATNQVELSLLHLDALTDGTLEQCIALGIQPMIWSPLGGGRLFTSSDAQAVRVRAGLEELGRELSVSPATVAYAWLLRHPSRPVPITGTRRIEAIHEAVAALAVRLSAEQWYQLLDAGAGHEVA